MKKLIGDSENVMGLHDSRDRDGVIALMDYALSKLTPEQRETATFGLEEYSYPYDPNEYTAFRIQFKRLETDKEEKQREALEAQYQAQREARDKAEYARLKKQFGE